MRNLLLLGVVSIAACVPQAAESYYVECDPAYDEDCYPDYEYGPSTSPFQDAFGRIFADRTTGFASLRSGEGVRISDTIQGWQGASIVLAPFGEKQCEVDRYPGLGTSPWTYVFLCGATDTPAALANVDSKMAEQIGSTVPSGWKSEHTEAGMTKLWSWGPPGEEPIVLLREEPAGADKAKLTFLVFGRIQAPPSVASRP